MWEEDKERWRRGEGKHVYGKGIKGREVYEETARAVTAIIFGA